MSLISGLTNQTIDYIYSVSKDQYGDVTRNTEYTDLQCRWQEHISKIIGKNNEEVLSKIEVWLLPEYIDIQEDWEIVKDDETYLIVGIEKLYNLSGVLDHIKLYLV